MPGSCYLIITVILSRQNAGERLPLLLSRASRHPVALANEWVFATRRCTVATNTILSDLRCVALLYEWASTRNIDLEDRLRSGRGLSPSEITTSLSPRIRQTRKSASGPSKRTCLIDRNHARHRIAVIGSFLDWALLNAEAALAASGNIREEQRVRNARERIATALGAVRPTLKRGGQALALTPLQLQQLIDWVSCSGDQSPWWHPDAKLRQAIRARNPLVIRLFVTFGLRSGDLLKLYTTDAVVHGSRPLLRIRRRPDDPHDTRRHEPNVKTQERDLPLTSDLALALDTYLREERPKIPGARRSPYLFLEGRHGRPLSSRSLADIFKPLRIEFPGIHPHVLRHTCNECLLKECDSLGIDRAQALKHMKYVNGWLGDNSPTYTRRLVREEAASVSLALQKTLFRR